MVKIASILDEEPDIQDRPGAKPLPRIEGDLEIDSVVFAYGKEPVLHGVAFRLAPGALLRARRRVGPREVDARAPRSAATTTRTRARCASTATTCATWSSARTGASSASCSRTRSSSAARSRRTSASRSRTRRTRRSRRRPRRSGVDRVAARLSGGLDHEVREGGAGLSAGERQLISIARALLADPRILVLDEATSNIDRPTEVLIEQALDRLLKGRTSIIIAHRLSTVRRADEILVVENGQIIQRGSERELLKQSTARSAASPTRSRAASRSSRSLASCLRAARERARPTSTTCGSNWCPRPLRAGAPPPGG